MRVKAKTYESLIENIKDKSLEELTKQEIFDLIIGYGTREDFSNISVQRMLIKYDFIDWLVCSIDTIIRDKEVINGILASNLFEDKKFKLIKCMMESLETETFGNGFYWLLINIIDKDTDEKKQIRYLCYKQDDDDYIREIKDYIGKDITIIALQQRLAIPIKEQTPNTPKSFKILKLCCILDTEEHKGEN